MDSSEKAKLLADLKHQHETFAEEIILRLKYYYRLYEKKPYPKNFSFATLDICDAVFAISFVFRCHYRQVYFALYNELEYSAEYEKYCFSLPVERSKRYTFNFLFRISFIFELTMYLFKDGHDYFDIARKCLAAYPDLLFFDAAGGWARLNEISAFIIRVTKVWEVDIAVEHPLLGTFIESDWHNPKDDAYLFDAKYLLQESIENCQMIESGVVPSFDEDFFNHNNMQSLRLLYKHFVAPRTPKSRCKVKDLIKIAETFPLVNRVPFEINDDADTHYYIVYDLYVEKKEILYYFRSYMDPEILEKYFPLKTSPDSPDEENYEDGNLGDIPEYFDFSPEGSVDSSQLVSPSDSFFNESPPASCDEDNLGDIPEYFISDFSHGDSEEDKSDISKSSFPEEYDAKIYKGMKLSCDSMMSSEKVNANMNSDNEAAYCTWSTNQCALSSNEDISQHPQLTPINPVTENLQNESARYSWDSSQGPMLITEDFREIPRLPSIIPEFPRRVKVSLIKVIMDVSRLSKDKKDTVIKLLPTMQEFRCFEPDFIKSILISVPHSPYCSSTILIDAFKNISYVSESTKYLLYKIITHCYDVTQEEKDELIPLLANIPDDPISQKIDVINVINKMLCTDQQKLELIQCVMDLSDEESEEIHRYVSGIQIVEDYKNEFDKDEDCDDHTEFDKFMEPYRNESEFRKEKLQELYRLAVEQAEYSSTLSQEEITARQLALRPRAKPRKLYQDRKKSLNEAGVLEHATASEKHFPSCADRNAKKEFCFSQEEFKGFEKTEIFASDAFVASTPRPLEKYSHKSEVPDPHRTLQRYKTTKKSKKRSKK